MTELETLRARVAELEARCEDLGTDAVTGLPTRRLLNYELDRAARRGQRHNLELALLMIDIDHFKRVNDEHGHQTGDLVLQEVAAVLRDGVRFSDFVGRYGGEEFLVIAEGVDVGGACILGEKLRSAVRHACPVGLDITISIGVATTTYPLQGCVKTLRQADAALYEAKDAGRDCVRYKRESDGKNR